MAHQPRYFSPYDVPMWDSIAEGAMQLPRCTRCGTVHYPPGPCCPECLSFDLAWEPLSGAGKVLSWTTFHRVYLPAYPAPHTVVAVQLQEGPIMIGYVSRADAGELVLDAPVTIAYAEHPDGYRIPHFRLTGAAP